MTIKANPVSQALAPFPMENLGPLAQLAGVWEGDKGDDIAPADDRAETENNKFRERMTFVPFGPVNNHEQTLYGLRYSTTAIRLGEETAFHEELGYWLWDARAKQVMRCFMVPRGVTVLAGGTVDAAANVIELAADVGSTTYGICSNKFLDEEFRTVRYELKLTIDANGLLTYEEDTQLQIKGQKALFHHRDRNVLKKVD